MVLGATPEVEIYGSSEVQLMEQLQAALRIYHGRKVRLQGWDSRNFHPIVEYQGVVQSRVFQHAMEFSIAKVERVFPEATVTATLPPPPPEATHIRVVLADERQALTLARGCVNRFNEAWYGGWFKAGEEYEVTILDDADLVHKATVRSGGSFGSEVIGPNWEHLQANKYGMESVMTFVRGGLG